MWKLKFLGPHIKGRSSEFAHMMFDACLLACCKYQRSFLDSYWFNKCFNPFVYTISMNASSVICCIDCSLKGKIVSQSWLVLCISLDKHAILCSNHRLSWSGNGALPSFFGHPDDAEMRWWAAVRDMRMRAQSIILLLSFAVHCDSKDFGVWAQARAHPFKLPTLPRSHPH